MADKKRTIHVISHTHWDREWYMPFEAHRFQLVKFFDRLLETLDNDPSFKSFHLDGQAIVIEDYLEIRPEMEEKIKKYIDEGRIVCGPWYILQDEYLVDGESNVRNMLVGRQVAAKYGKVSDIGYFPDAFGNIGQAPQILRGFGIDCVAFGRGVSERHGDRRDTGEANYGKATSEIIWRAPDGSEVNGAVFLHWYSNGNEIPSDIEEAKKRVQLTADKAAECATNPNLLFMNGCDHQPVQTDIGQIIDKLNAAGYPDTLIHSTFRQYFDAILPYRDQFGIFVGELDGEFSDGWWTLANTASARIYLKQLNSQCETLLEKNVEPLSVASYLLAGDDIRRDHFRFLWKTLLKNHPHDSICGCSCDDVHAGMVTRFKKVLAFGGETLKAEKEALGSVISTDGLGYPYAVTVFNPAAQPSSEAVTVNLDLPEDSKVEAGDIAVFDGETQIPADVKDMGIMFDYILPDDAFRVPFNVHRFELTFNAHEVPAIGYKSFGVALDCAAKTGSDLTVHKNGMENSRLKVRFGNDGTATVTDRKTGNTFDTGIMLDVGDIGDEYIFREANDQTRVSTEGVRAKIAVESATAAAITFRVTHTMLIPSGVNHETGIREGACDLVIRNYFTLREGAERLDVKTVIENNAENHRVTMLTRHNIQSDLIMAEGQFDIVKRDIATWEGWKNPTNPRKMTTFFGLEDEKNGLLIAGRGLCEYEVLRDKGHTMALTLHRGVDRLGDWGVFPTPDAQCKGELTVEYALVPYSTTRRGDRDRAIGLAYRFASYAPAAFCKAAHGGKIDANGVIFGVNGTGFETSALKMCEFRDSVIFRVFNPNETDTKMSLDLGEQFSAIYESDLAENRGKKILARNGKANVAVPAKKIVTVELVK